MAKLAFLGLGVMGAPMAGHLQKAGHEVTVYNRTEAKAQDWVKAHGGAMAKTPCEAAKDAELVMACVGNDNDLRSVCLGEDGAFAGMTAGAIFVDHTTVSAAVTRELYAAADAGAGSLGDSAIAGGGAGRGGPGPPPRAETGVSCWSYSLVKLLENPFTAFAH